MIGNAATVITQFFKICLLLVLLVFVLISIKGCYIYIRAIPTDRRKNYKTNHPSPFQKLGRFCLCDKDESFILSEEALQLALAK
jgi:hypothetical protein